MFKRISLIRILPAGLALCAVAVTALQSTDEVTPELAGQIEQALPKSAPAKPIKPRKILIFSKTNGFRHTSIATGVRAITRMGVATQAFSTVHTEDDSLFSKESLSQFDAIIFLNTTGDVFRPVEWPADETAKQSAQAREKELQQNLVDFVKSGKGLIGIHAATDTYHDWPEYRDMMGGVFNSHPWHELVPVHNMDPTHPLNATFKGQNFEIADEIYQFKDGTAQPKDRRMLLSLDPKWSGLSKGSRADNLWPISWISRYGDGRTFYCSLGHREEIYANPTILEHFLAGFQFALGDLAADPAPIPPQH